MSMITGCPACGTMFRVVPDQLKISEGWVRCGHCGDVFDAAAHLRPEPPVEAASPAAPAGGDVVDVVDVVDVGDTAPPAADVAAPAKTAEPGPAPPATPRPTPSPEARDSAIEISDFFAEAKPHFLRESPVADVEPRPSQSSTWHLDDEDDWPPAPAHEDDDDAPEEVEDVSFVREARRKEMWRRPAVRLALALAALGLLALLGLQYAVQERHRLAAESPGLRPWLAGLCVPLGCTVGAPRRIEAILIDNSGFTRLRPDTYRLSFSLRNQSRQPVAVPALQLTLTDAQDQPVLQRVLTPPELGAASDTIAPSSEFTASVALAVSADAGRIAGYRLLAFYP